MSEELMIGYPLSASAQAYVAQRDCVRQRHRTCSEQELIELLERHRLPVSDALLDFERNLGGWNDPRKNVEYGMGIFLALQEGDECSLIAKRFRRSSYLFEVAEPNEDGEVLPIQGTGFPRAFFQDRALVPAGMLGQEHFLFIGVAGEIYKFNNTTGELFMPAASGRSYLEHQGVMQRRWPDTGWKEMHFRADVSDFVVNLLGVERFEPACDRLFDVWANDRAIVRLVCDVAPNVFGTHILTKTADDALHVFNRVRSEHSEAEVVLGDVNDMLRNSGQYIAEGKLF